MRQALLEKLALVISAAIVVGGTWFWILMVRDVLDTLELAYG